MDAFLIPHTIWDILNPTSYYTHTFSSVGGHGGVRIHTNITIPCTDPPHRSIANIMHWCNKDLKILAHFFALPHNLPLHDKSQRIMDEVRHYVQARQDPLPPEDLVVLLLRSRLQSSARDQRAVKEWGEHIQKQSPHDVLCRLRRFYKSAVTTTGVFSTSCAIGSRNPSRDLLYARPLNLPWKSCRISLVLLSGTRARHSRSLRAPPAVYPMYLWKSRRCLTFNRVSKPLRINRKAWLTYLHICLHTYVRHLSGLCSSTCDKYGSRNLSPPLGEIRASPYSAKKGARVMRAIVAPSRPQAARTKFCASCCCYA